MHLCTYIIRIYVSNTRKRTKCQSKTEINSLSASTKQEAIILYIFNLYTNVFRWCIHQSHGSNFALKSEVKHGGPKLRHFQSPLRNFYYTRKHERPRRETQTDVSQGLHWLPCLASLGDPKYSLQIYIELTGCIRQVVLLSTCGLTLA